MTDSRQPGSTYRSGPPAWLGWLVLAGAVYGLFGGLLRRKIEEVIPGKALPELAGTDINDLDGQPLALAHFKGKVLLVDFWDTWCEPCMGEMPNVIATYNKYHGQGFEILGVSLDADKARLLAVLKSQKMTWPQYFDGQAWNNRLARQYGISFIPNNYLLDANGRVIGEQLRGEALGQAVAAALKK